MSIVGKRKMDGMKYKVKFFRALGRKPGEAL
jgi:hypothetical protein